MLISQAFAQAVPPVADPGSTIMMNIVMIGVMVVLFYVLLIRPQQKRFKEHSNMLAALKKGDKIITGGGLIGTIDKITEGNDEVIVDLGNGLKVTAIRSSLQSKTDIRVKPANDVAAKDKKNKESKN